ncbi:MAG: hypothetical protein ACQEQ7_01705 [Thermodesulfobacteriota bacterium]
MEHKENNYRNQVEGNAQMVEKSHGKIEAGQQWECITFFLHGAQNKPHACKEKILRNDFRYRKGGEEYLKPAEKERDKDQKGYKVTSEHSKRQKSGTDDRKDPEHGQNVTGMFASEHPMAGGE